jgi:hypothetical protein
MRFLQGFKGLVYYEQGCSAKHRPFAGKEISTSTDVEGMRKTAVTNARKCFGDAKDKKIPPSPEKGRVGAKD